MASAKATDIGSCCEDATSAMRATSGLRRMTRRGAECVGCPSIQGLLQEGTARNIRVARKDQPRSTGTIPSSCSESARATRSGPASSAPSSRLKVNLNAEHLTYRDAHRVQARLDRKLLTLHVLLEVAAPP